MHSYIIYINLCIILLLATTEEITVEKTGSGGLAFEVILAPASTDAAPRPPSPTKDKTLSQADIEKKLKEAEERRLVCIYLALVLLCVTASNSLIYVRLVTIYIQTPTCHFTTHRPYTYCFNRQPRSAHLH